MVISFYGSKYNKKRGQFGKIFNFDTLYFCSSLPIHTKHSANITHAKSLNGCLMQRLERVYLVGTLLRWALV